MSNRKNQDGQESLTERLPRHYVTRGELARDEKYNGAEI